MHFIKEFLGTLVLPYFILSLCCILHCFAGCILHIILYVCRTKETALGNSVHGVVAATTDSTVLSPPRHNTSQYRSAYVLSTTHICYLPTACILANLGLWKIIYYVQVPLK